MKTIIWIYSHQLHVDEQINKLVELKDIKSTYKFGSRVERVVLKNGDTILPIFGLDSSGVAQAFLGREVHEVKYLFLPERVYKEIEMRLAISNSIRAKHENK